MTKHSNTLATTDQRIVEDVHDFCRELLDLFRSVFKPIIDILFFASALYRNSGVSPTGFITSYYLLIATMTSSSLSSFTELIAISQEKEGVMRSVYNQITLHAEEISFYKGEELEQTHVNKVIESLLNHERKIKRLKWWSGIVDNLLIKYGSVCCGYIVCAAVVADNRNSMSASKLAELYLQTTQLYIPMSRAIGQLLLLHKKIGALCASTHRLGELLDICNTSSAEIKESFCPKERLENIINSNNDNDELSIVFKKVNIQAPNGICLIKHFSFRFDVNKHVLIVGCNGSGKSSIVRLISGLWSPSEGCIEKPDANHIYILPQRCYLPPGTLRNQLTYPINDNKFEMCHLDDTYLMHCASCMGMAYLIEREGGFESVRNWNEVLSGGERQRLALVRVLVNHPTFAVLDECTSAISQEDELILLKHLQNAGITLITISHRQALTSIHNIIIELGDNGEYSVRNVNITA